MEKLAGRCSHSNHFNCPVSHRMSIGLCKATLRSSRDGIRGHNKVQYTLFATSVWIQIHSPLRPVIRPIFQCIQAGDAQNDVNL
jgi:hypothetical protein